MTMSESNNEDLLDTEWESSEDEEEAKDAAEAAPAGETDEAGGGRPRRQRRRRRAPDKRDEHDTPPEDERAAKALDFVRRLVDKMQMDCTVRLRRPRPDADEHEINLEISGRDAGRIIGKKGQVLAAIQFITNRVINRPGLERRYVTVDAEGYRNRRDSSLASMARRLGKQAVSEGKIITFEPMNPRDRRVVHLALAKFEGVITKSEGEGDQRRVQIIPVRR